MILGDNFVYIHFPKTGGTFITKTLIKLHEGKGWGRLDPNRKLTRIAKLIGMTGGSIINLDYDHYSKHGVYRQIPFAFKGKKIFSTVRNPFDRYVSQYEFGYWKKFPERFFFDIDNFLKLYPDFQNLSFSDYIRLVNISKHIKRTEDSDLNSEYAVGRQTYDFINFFFKKPVDSVILGFNENYILNSRYKEDIAPVHFLKKENLNQELYNFLSGIGYKEQEISFILNSQKIYPKKGGRSENQAWESYYTPELKQYIKNREKLIFSIFPEYDI
jgi:hypothetical protein